MAKIIVIIINEDYFDDLFIIYGFSLKVIFKELV
jgi:hypothetical protein